MCDLYPFQAITNCTYQANMFKDSLEDNLNHIIHLLQKGSLSTYQKENFYCCKISNGFVSITGIIALIKADLVNKLIIQHEKSIRSKEEVYTDNFMKYKIQLSPIILIHENKLSIRENLNKLINDCQPFLEINNKEYKFEIWPTNNIDVYKGLYKNLNTLWLADGHHRLAAINKIDKKSLISAFFLPKNYIKSADIYREYINISMVDKQQLFSFLYNNFTISKVSSVDNLSYNNFIVRFNNDCIYEVQGSNSSLPKRKILEFLERSINYDKGTLNFYNLAHRNHLIFNTKDTLAILIPAYKFLDFSKSTSLLPPHSTFFYPKIPDGLIVNYITSSIPECFPKVRLKQAM